VVPEKGRKTVLVVILETITIVQMLSTGGEEAKQMLPELDANNSVS